MTHIDLVSHLTRNSLNVLHLLPLVGLLHPKGYDPNVKCGYLVGTRNVMLWSFKEENSNPPPNQESPRLMLAKFSN
ncbi:hypothetical protein SESBI_32706 [Sesbania bispinosa]|nr:hypothetical protein SESBI_32706 [Sesbania bispinosa]